jgi:prolyl-tRNA editing enzyme YbaK/EbsC (Cys-tRNA(Pro) deacylase)
LTVTPADDLPASARRVLDAAGDLGLDIEVRAFPEGTRTADDAARAIGCDVGQIVKSLVFQIDGEVVLALVSGSNRLDEAKLATAAGAAPGSVGRADADSVRAATSYAVGGVPPFGHPGRLRTWVDLDLLDHEVVWAAAGTPTHVFSVAPAALVEATGAVPADLAAR